MDLMSQLRRQWDRVAAWVAVGIGVLALILGYRGVSGTKYLVEQVPYIVSGAVVGLFALGLGATLWLSADLRDEWQKLDDVERTLDRIARPEVAPPP
jgi:hypothetical protein